MRLNGDIVNTTNVTVILIVCLWHMSQAYRVPILQKHCSDLPVDFRDFINVAAAHFLGAYCS